MSTAATIGLTLLAIFMVLVVLNVPIAVCLGISTLVTSVIFHVPYQGFGDILYTGIAKSSLLAVPFFILCGAIMEKSGTSARIVKFANCLVGPIPGGLAVMSIILTCFWGAISGNGPATVYALGSVLIPAMISAGYSPAFAAACIAASSAISVVIPPSTTLIVYGVMAGASVSDLYLAGFVPGVMMGALMCGWAIFISIKRNYRGADHFGSKEEILKTLKDSWLGLLAPVFILGSIYAGIATPTESAVIGCVYAMIIGTFAYRGIKFKNLLEIFKSSAKSTATLMLIIGCASCFSWLVTSQGIAGAVSSALMGISNNKYVLGFLCALILLIAGFFLDGISISYLFYPLLWPVVSALGYSNIWFGVVLSMAIAVGMATPPVAVNIYPACHLAKIKMSEITKDIFGFVAMGFLAMIIVLFVPQIIDFMPALLGGK